MRTSILGIHDWWDTNAVEKNAVDICKVTHRDPRYSKRNGVVISKIIDRLQSPVTK